MRAAAPDEAGGWQSAIIDRVDARISSVGEDQAGELYMTDLSSGTVYQIGYTD